MTLPFDGAIASSPRPGVPVSGSVSCVQVTPPFVDLNTPFCDGELGLPMIAYQMLEFPGSTASPLTRPPVSTCVHDCPLFVERYKPSEVEASSVVEVVEPAVDLSMMM